MVLDLNIKNPMAVGKSGDLAPDGGYRGGNSKFLDLTVLLQQYFCYTIGNFIVILYQ